MIENRSAIPDLPEITPDLVTSLYKFKTTVNTLDPADYPQLLEEYGLTKNLSTKKEIISAWLEKYFPCRPSLEERQLELNKELVCLQQQLEVTKAQSAVLVFGSAAKGIINSPYSDLDLFVVVDRNLDEPERLAQVIKRQFVVANSLAPLSDIIPLSQNGTGLARAYTVSHQGVESEFHFFGELDALKIHLLKPGSVKRIRPVPAKMEKLSNFQAGVIELSKPEDRVWHYLRHAGQVYRGFFPEAIITGQIVYDPKGLMKQVLQNLWLANIKAYLYHNGFYRKNGRVVFSPEQVNFEGFMITLGFGQGNQFSDLVEDELRNRFNDSLKVWRQKLQF